MMGVETGTQLVLTRELAKLGGFLGRKSDGEPGWITIWRGWQKLYLFIRGVELNQTAKKCGQGQDVDARVSLSRVATLPAVVAV